ncbi:MAG: hypothetical protein HKM93_08880 [Desulfobacteraceae bacterium]|nr:hypothetical protein [Desulfobacteraceae bacterium]
MERVKEGISPERKMRAAESFKKNYFWKNIFEPALQLAQAEFYEELRTCRPDELEGKQAKMDAIDMYLNFPDLVIDSAKEDLEIERSEEDPNGEDEE